VTIKRNLYYFGILLLEWLNWHLNSNVLSGIYTRDYAVHNVIVASSVNVPAEIKMMYN
jgi:hypothetical protein